VADQERGDLEGEESLDFLEQMDDVSRGVRLGGRNGASRAAYAKLSGPQLTRLVHVSRMEQLGDEEGRAVAELMASGRAESLRDDELVAMARMAAKGDVLAGSLWEEAYEETRAWGALPPVPLYIPTSDRGGQKIVDVKPGGMVTLTGGTGTGKTSLALEMARCHAQWIGPAAFFGLELKKPVSAARIIGQHHGVGWMDAARLGEEEMRAALRVPRAHLFGRLSLGEMRERVVAMQKRYPEPLLVIVDYAQILLDDMTERLAFATIIETLRRMIADLMFVGLVTSQTSRSGAERLRSSESMGKETESAGAESAQLERAADLTLTLGAKGEDDGHGWCGIDLNVGKARMATDDLVVPLRYHGAWGRFSWAGEAEKAGEVKARRVVEKEEKARKEGDERAERKVLDHLGRVGGAVTRRSVEDEIGGRRDMTRAAISRLIRSGQVVEIGESSRKGYYPPIGLPMPAAPTAHDRPDMGPNQRAVQSGKSGPTPLVGVGRSASETETPQSTFGTWAAEARWSPTEEHKSYAVRHGLDLAALASSFRPGPGPLDAQFMLVLAREVASRPATGRKPDDPW